jgi:hypothetical protein
MKKNILLFAFCSMLFTFCKKEATSNLNFTYRMTQCADPWQDDAYFKDKEAALKAYLKKEGVTVVSLSVVEDSPGIIACAACTCPGNYIANVTTDSGDEAKMVALKFTKK